VNVPAGWLNKFFYRAVLYDLVDHVDVGQKHPPTTIPSNTHVVQDFSGVLPVTYTRGKLAPLVPDKGATRKAPDREYHESSTAQFHSHIY